MALYSPIQTDLVVAVRDQGYMFVTGPDVIKDVTGEEVTLDELGGADAQARYGNIHSVVNSEKEAFQYVRDFLEFLPANTFDDPPIVNPGLEPELTPHDYELDSIVPDNDNTAYDMHEILLRIFDDGDVFEVAEQQGPAGDRARPSPPGRGRGAGGVGGIGGLLAGPCRGPCGRLRRRPVLGRHPYTPLPQATCPAIIA